MLLPFLGRANICGHDFVREIILPLVVLLYIIILLYSDGDDVYL